jgi:hypothetical protein
LVLALVSVLVFMLAVVVTSTSVMLVAAWLCCG